MLRQTLRQKSNLTSILWVRHCIIFISHFLFVHSNIFTKISNIYCRELLRSDVLVLFITTKQPHQYFPFHCQLVYSSLFFVAMSIGVHQYIELGKIHVNSRLKLCRSTLRYSLVGFNVRSCPVRDDLCI